MQSWDAWSQGFGLAESRVRGALISALSQPRASSSPRWSSVEGPEEKPPDMWEPQGRETHGRQGLRQCISSSCCVPKAPVLSPQPGGFCACVGGGRFQSRSREKRKLLTLLITEQSWNKQTWRAQS